MASSIFGGLANAIDGGPKLNRITYSPVLDTELNAVTSAQAGNRAANQVDLSRLSGAARAAAGQVEKLTPGDLEILQSVINQRTDPFSTYTSVGNYNFGLLDRIAGGLAQQGRAGESRRMAALGYGGQGQSTYQSNTLLDRISKNLAPVYAQTLGNIGRDASAIDTGRINQNANTVNLMNYRASVPGRSLPLYQLPINTRQQITEDEIANLLGLGEGYRTNTAGFREKATALGSIAGSLDSAVDTGLSLYSGGMLGGMLGGGGGGGARPSVSQGAGFSPANFGPSGYGGFGVSYTGAPLQPQFPPSGYGQFGVSYQPGAWTPNWN